MELKARYRKLVDPAEAVARLVAALGAGRTASERIASADAAGRVTAEPVFARISSPPYHCAAMDGIAVVSRATRGASAARPKLLTSPGEAVPIDTGDRMPDGYDAVVPVELLNERPGGYEIRAAAAPRQHVRLTGEDMVAGEMILASGRRIRPEHVGAMLSANATDVAVRRPVRVGVLPTGDELCEPGEDPSDGRVIESNSRMIAAALARWGAQAQRLEPVRDDPRALAEAIRKAAADPALDALAVLAGSSAGRGDFGPRVIGELGELVFHGLAIMPGKPTAAGLVGGKPVIGLPGFAVSAIVAAEIVLRPVVCSLLGVRPVEPERLRARLSRAVASRPGQEEWIRAVVGLFERGAIASPLGRGAGAITTLSRAHGILRVPAASEGVEAGTEVSVELLVPRSELESSLLFAGSHDLALAVLDDMLGQAVPGAGLNVTPLGSMGGLAALARGEAHLAGSHLLDPQSGTYNLHAVSELLPDAELVLVTLAHRQQGLCTRPDEPRAVSDLPDALRAGLRFVNRQAGSGTRVLTDFLLSRAGIDPAGVDGYEHEEFTHVAVAEAVRSHAADCGMLIQAAARALGLRFVPLIEERYDLVIPRRALEDERIRVLLEILSSEAFRQRVTALGGYDTRETGQRIEVA
ncbi:MAG: molybdopterin biosynthesis protein [Deltaproteobacteria bacterium]|nr:molybdopterin biosynthesis protein [Deltaproteobacteria bacterium]